MSAQKSYSRNSEIVATWIDDEIVMMSVQSGKYFTLNRPAASIWDALSESRGIEEIVAMLLKQYSVSESVCRKEVSECIEDIVNKNLVLEGSK